MALIVDTSIFIDAEQGRLNIEKLNALEEYQDIFIAAITVSELLVGVQLAKGIENRIRRSAFVESIISKIPVLEFNTDVARTYAEIYSNFIKPRSKQAGSVHDLQIAATAITYGHSVLTSNMADFKKVPGLLVKSAS